MQTSNVVNFVFNIILLLYVFVFAFLRLFLEPSCFLFVGYSGASVFPAWWGAMGVHFPISPQLCKPLQPRIFILRSPGGAIQCRWCPWTISMAWHRACTCTSHNLLCKWWQWMGTMPSGMPREPCSGCAVLNLCKWLCNQSRGGAINSPSI